MGAKYKFHDYQNCTPPILLFFAALILLCSCHQKKTSIEKGFYYWKTGLSFSSEELQKLSSLQIKKLYTRFFDINIENNEPVPVAKISIGNKPPVSVEIVPVVFITNKTLAAITGNQIGSLSTNIAKLIDQTATANGISYREVQIDCDWNLTTKEKYFSLLQQIKTKLPAKTLSCTIRLHQVKYFRKTGIPPVDRGMLMFYNMGELQSMNDNSIFNEKDAGKYVASGKSYPLPLDIALPIFGWVKHFRQNQLIGLVDQLTEAGLQKDTSFVFSAGHRYSVLKDLFYRGEYLKKGDLLVAEEITPAVAKDAARLVKKNFKTDSCAVVLYHWDQLNLSRYDNKEIENIYTVFQ